MRMHSTGWFGGLAILMLTLAPKAHAQWAVVDVGAIAKLVQQITVMQQQLQTAENQFNQAQQQFQSMTGGRGMEQLLSNTVRNYLPSDWQTLQTTLVGLDAAEQGNAVLSPAMVAQLSAPEQQQLANARRNAAVLQVASQQALQVTSDRFASLQQLINAIPTATDQKGILDLQARIAAEQAMLQNEQTKLMLIYQATQADNLAQRQRSQELAIQTRGSLRSLGPIGLPN
jgi:type IV secretion system protein VirB5